MPSFSRSMSLTADGLLDYGPKVTLQFETALEWGPINYKNKQHKCVGRADYTMFFGERDHIACHLVVVEAKKDTTGTGLGQLLAYMAMVRASRKARGQSDSTVWGYPYRWGLVFLCSAGQCRAMVCGRVSSYPRWMG